MSRMLVDMLHTWHKAHEQRQSVRVLCVDFCKAFDCVDHAKVIDYLARLEIPGPAIKCFGSFLTRRQQRVKIGNTVSTWLTLNGSILQGSWLWLLTFYHCNRYFEIVMFYQQTTNMWTPPCVGFWHLANLVSLTTIWLSCLNGRCQITWKLMNAKRKK